jgi:hypothetical protein
MVVVLGGRYEARGDECVLVSVWLRDGDDGVVGWYGAWLWGRGCVGVGCVMVSRWSLGGVGADEDGFCVCVGGVV